MAHPAYRLKALKLLRCRLDPKHPGNGAAPSVKAALEEMRYYLDTWVYPLIEVIENGPNAPYRGCGEHVENDHAAMVARIERREGRS